MKPLKSICILRLSSIGDVTHIVPIINTIKKNSIESSITWIIGSIEYELVKTMPGINFIVINKKNLFGSVKKLRNLNGGYPFDVLLHMQVSLRSNLLSIFLKANRKIGFNKNLSKNFHSFFIDESIKEKHNQHVFDTFALFLEKINMSDISYDWNINISNKKSMGGKYKKYCIINPFTSNRRFNYREWDMSRYISIAEYVKKNFNINTIIVGGKSDYEKNKSIRFDGYEFIFNLVGKTSLQDLYRLIRDSEFYLGPDSGTLHIASMLKKNVIGLFATSNPYRTGPFRNMTHTINKYPQAINIYLHKDIDSVKWGKRVRNSNAMDLITVDDVKSKVDEILSI
tara:strand:- start:380 stop:1402 length:1023 start_codon:yes stop_codon:yes gene_type:complete